MAMTVAAAEVLSPELVLIDPRLAAAARASMPDSSGAYGQPEESEPPAMLIADETEAARRRLIELSVVRPPDQRRRFRATKLAGAMATWTAVVLLAVDTQLYTLFR